MKITVRILLFIAILCGGGTIFVHHKMTTERIAKGQTERDNYAAQRDTEAAEKTKVQGELAQAQTELTATKAQLDGTTTELTAKTKEADGYRDEANNLQTEKSKVDSEYAAWRREHDAFVKLDRKPAQILKAEADLKETITQRDTLIQDNKLLALNLNKEQNENISLRSRLFGVQKVQLPKGLQGRVVAVDPKYEFVVLNIGDRQGVKVEGEMVVDHGGQPVALLKIAEVATDHSVANIRPLGNAKDPGRVLEGDKVVVASSNL